MKSCSIIVVDDEQNFRSGLRRVFSVMPSDVSFEILEASNGAEAMRTLEERQVDCVLLDQGMPGGDGLQWLSRMLDRDKYLAVIMVTGKGSERIAVEAMKHGAMDYLVKGDISSEMLYRAIVNAMEKVAMRRMIEQQQKNLIDAERHRVMFESLGAACHHLGSPTTVIVAYLEMMKNLEKSPEMLAMIDECIKAAGILADVLKRLQQVNTYRTESYIPLGEGEAARPDEKILAI